MYNSLVANKKTLFFGKVPENEPIQPNISLNLVHFGFKHWCVSCSPVSDLGREFWLMRDVRRFTLG